MGFYKVANFIFFLLALVVTVSLIINLYDIIRLEIIMYGDIQFDLSFVYFVGMIVLGFHFTKKYYKRLAYSDEDHKEMLRDKYAR